MGNIPIHAFLIHKKQTKQIKGYFGPLIQLLENKIARGRDGRFASCLQLKVQCVRLSDI